MLERIAVAVGFVFVASGCEAGAKGGTKGPATIDEPGLARCFASAYGDADVDASFRQCEEKHFGTEWRKEPPPKVSDARFVTNGSGNLDPRLVHAAIEARMPRVRSCYKTALRRDTSLRANLRVRFTVDENGRGSRVEDAGSHTRDKELTTCIHAEFASMRFPRPEGGVITIVYPILIGPGDV